VPVALVSGANRGIGRETARQLAGRGYDVTTSGWLARSRGLDAIQAALDTNFLCAYRLTIALLPLLRESEHARVVNVSSGMGGARDGRMVAWLPHLEGGAQRDDSNSRHRARAGRGQGQLRMPWFGDDRHGRSIRCTEAR